MRTFKDREDALRAVNDMPWGNAAGTCKDSKTARQFAQTGMSVVKFGSIMDRNWAGNPGSNFRYDEKTGASVNALGVPNRGYDGYPLRDIAAEVRSLGAKFAVSF